MWFTEYDHDNILYLIKLSLTHQSEWIISLYLILLLNNFNSLFLHRHFLLLELLLWMELPTCGSLMSTSVAMPKLFFLPSDLLNLIPSLMWRRNFTSLPLSFFHSFPTLGNYMVIQAIKTTRFSMPQVMFIINNFLVIKTNIRILILLCLICLSLVQSSWWDISLALPVQCVLSWEDCYVFSSLFFLHDLGNGLNFFLKNPFLLLPSSILLQSTPILKWVPQGFQQK